MAIINPKNQTINEIVSSLLINEQRQYTKSAHAEIYRRLIDTISNFNKKTEKIEKVMLILAFSQVILAVTQIILSVK